MKQEVHEKRCWCNASDLRNWNDDYYHCAYCGSLVSAKNREDSLYTNINTNSELPLYYSQQMFEAYRKMGCENLNDIILLHYRERVAHWLHYFLQYKLPPAKTLEIGCGLGTFVHALQGCGFDAEGVEMSAEQCKVMSEKLNIPMKAWDIMTADKTYNEKFDALILLDVIEHIEEPIPFMEKMYSMLKKDGILLAQLPCFPNKEFEAVQDTVFANHLNPFEHVILHSTQSIQHLLSMTGFKHMNYLPAIFPADMFFVAGKQPLTTYPQSEIENVMCSDPRRIGVYANAFTYMKQHIPSR